MRTVTAMGAAIGALGVAAALALAPAVVARGQQAAPPGQQAEKPADPKVEQKVEKKVVTTGAPGQRMTVTVEQKDGADPHVTVRQIGEPAIAGLMGGPRLGVEIRDVTKEDVAALKLSGQNGVVIAGVTKDSAAEKAGVKANDVVVSYDGETVRSAQQFTRLVRETAPGRTVKMTVVRQGARVDLDAAPAVAHDEKVSVFLDHEQMRGDIDKEIEKQAQELGGQVREFRLQRHMQGLPAEGEAMPPGEHFQWFGGDSGAMGMLLAPGRGRLGVTVQELTPELAAYFGVKDGLLVSAVRADSPAAKAGIKAGDVITTLNDKAVSTAGELVKGLGAKGGEVTIGVTRDKKPLTLKAAIEEPKAPARRTLLRGVPA